MSEGKEITHYSLSELAQSLKNVLRRTYTSRYWVRAEILRLNLHAKSGHCYPELIEKSGEQIKTQMRAVIWATQFEKLATFFKRESGEELRSGLSVLIRVTVEYHELYGLSLQIHDIEPSFTLGALARQRLETMARLKKEGLWNANKMRAMPLLPARIAVISANDSKGFQDFVQTLQASPYRIEYELFTAILQGEKSVRTIPQQLQRIEDRLHEFDAVSIIRGGGSDVGLSAYDQYNLAKAVAEFPLPVISGIGHSTNETLTELVAYKNPITPTAVAWFFIRAFEDQWSHLSAITNQMKTSCFDLVWEEQQKLADYSAHLVREPKRILQAQQKLLQQTGRQLTSNCRHILWKSAYELDRHQKNIRKSGSAVLPLSQSYIGHLSNQLLRKMQHLLAKENQEFGRLENAVVKSINRKLATENQNLLHLEERFRLLHPQNILKRGFSISYCGGKVIFDAAEVKKGDLIRTKLASGQIVSRVERKEKSENNG